MKIDDYKNWRMIAIEGLTSTSHALFFFAGGKNGTATIKNSRKNKKGRLPVSDMGRPTLYVQGSNERGYSSWVEVSQAVVG
jgi:hypothetical protein